MSVVSICYSNIPIDGVVKLTESERDNIDADAMKYMKLCNETLSKFKSKCEIFIHFYMSPLFFHQALASMGSMFGFVSLHLNLT